jgi:hypothetical protein
MLRGTQDQEALRPATFQGMQAPMVFHRAMVKGMPDQGASSRARFLEMLDRDGRLQALRDLPNNRHTVIRQMFRTWITS